MAVPAAERKASIRRRMLLARDLVDDRLLRSVSLWARVAELPAYAEATMVMAYAALGGEPDTDPLVARLARDGKTLVLPSVQDDRIVPRLVGPGLERGALGVLEPRGEVVPPRLLDVVIVPGVAFTLDGRRLGRGRGHYDRFLAELPPSCTTIGVCFAEHLVDDLPVEPHDRDVSVVVVDDLAG